MVVIDARVIVIVCKRVCLCVVLVFVHVHEFVSMGFLRVHAFAWVDVLLLRVGMPFASVRVVTLCVHTF